MYEVKFMRHAKELLDMKGQSQREDRVPCILELLRIAKSHSPWFEENILHVKTAGASETYTMLGGKKLVVDKEDSFIVGSSRDALWR